MNNCTYGLMEQQSREKYFMQNASLNYCSFVYWSINPNTFAKLVGKVRKNYLLKEEGRKEGRVEKKAGRGLNPGPAVC